MLYLVYYNRCCIYCPSAYIHMGMCVCIFMDCRYYIRCTSLDYNIYKTLSFIPYLSFFDLSLSLSLSLIDECFLRVCSYNLFVWKVTEARVLFLDIILFLQIINISNLQRNYLEKLMSFFFPFFNSVFPFFIFSLFPNHKH